MKSEEQAHAKYKFLTSPRCGAKTRSGSLCKSPAMANGRCRLHGGKSTGPPKGNQNALKHGYYTQAAIDQRKSVRRLMKESKALFEGV